MNGIYNRGVTISFMRQNIICIDKMLSKISLPNRDKIFFVGTILVVLSEKSYRDLYKSFELKSQSSLLEATIAVLKSIAQVRCEYKKELYEMQIRLESIVRKNLIGKKKEFSLYQLIDTIALYTSETIEYIDEFYSEFITSSSGNRTVTGIVLTPNHIAEFMAQLLEIKEDDTVLDICCGCGTLLLAADHQVNSHNNYFGCEVDHEIYLLGVMNAICQKSNITMMQEDCFSECIKGILHTSFSKGMLNPPYSHMKYSALDFLLRELEFIQGGGEVAIICPTSCAMSAKYYKERYMLMQKHTLQAVLSMPEDLFCGNGAFTYTCIMIWKANVPHNREHKVYFARCNYDGFRRYGRLGRIDKTGAWPNIKKEWLERYRNRQVIQGLTALHTVTAECEWLPEAYIISDSIPEKADFEKTLIDYLVYCARTYGISQEES